MLLEKAEKAKKEAESYQDQGCYNAAYQYGYNKGFADALSDIAQKLSERNSANASSAIKLFGKNSNVRKTVDMKALTEIIGEITGNELSPALFEVSVSKNGDELFATVRAEDDYPGIDVDCWRKEGENEPSLHYLGNFELPNIGNPDVTSRLYAGNPEFETDSPVALMVYRNREKSDNTQRVVYIDTEAAMATDSNRYNTFVRTVAELKGEK